MEKERGVILCVHGLAGDSRIFNYAASKLSEAGHSVYAIDLPGYGNSDGEKVDVPFETTMQALQEVVKGISMHAGALFMLGFSLGGLYALWYAALHPGMLKGVIAITPQLRLKGVKRNRRAEPSKGVFLAALLGYFLTPAKKIHIGRAVPSAFGELAGEEWVDMMKDPLCSFHCSYRYIFNVLIGRAQNVDVLRRLKVPLLVLHGNNDWIVVPEQSKMLLKMIWHSDKEMKTFDCDHWFYHAFYYKQNKYSELERVQVIASIDEWVRQRL